MQGASRDSLAALREQLPTDGELTELSEQLYAVVSLLTVQASLRRALSDPASAEATKVGVVDSLFGSRLNDAALELVREAARRRWSQPRDLLDSLETLAVDAALAAAEGAGDLDSVEDELFRFERILDAEPELRAALTNRNYPAEAKQQMLHRLLDGKVNAVTFNLLERAVLEPRGRTIERALRDLSSLAAQRRERLIAHVTSAVELTEDEQRDLIAALGRAFSHDVRLQVVVDPSIVGGLTVRIGDEIIDASVARQLDEARRKLTGKSGSRA
ncbi:MAG: F0F1 ATP synthase subunit delta [Frankiaceae bacterium]|nr:F0F1 ATP synthase subunit delta [Frankiaceae bacterium]MBV9871999.1 F0F1 ATP synthase subunit delta [Frankiaceae bacterium]